jgi:ribA/ribD-fused uncharacterized protein
MELNPNDFYLDNLHRLPSNGKGPRPIIVKFVSALDRNLFWSKKHMLSHTNLIFREHFCSETEQNIKVLLPIKREAIGQKMKIKLTGHKLFINNTKYGVKTLESLPESLKHARYGCKLLQDKLFFFSGTSPLSNFHPSPFSVDGMKYTCGEQYLQWKKATLFNCDNIAKEIVSSSNPAQMKKLSSKISNFNSSVWKEAIPEIAKSCVKNKFDQNPTLKDYLVSTAPNKLFEAAPNDSLWGIGCSLYDPNILTKEKDWGKNILGITLQNIRRNFTS